MAGIDFSDSFAVLSSLLATTEFTSGLPTAIIQDVYSIPELQDGGVEFPLCIIQSAEAIKFSSENSPAQLKNISLPVRVYFITAIPPNENISSDMAYNASCLYHAILSDRNLSGTCNRIEVDALDWSPTNDFNAQCVEEEWNFTSAMIEFTLTRSISR